MNLKKKLPSQNGHNTPLFCFHLVETKVFHNFFHMAAQQSTLYHQATYHFFSGFWSYSLFRFLSSSCYPDTVSFGNVDQFTVQYYSIITNRPCQYCPLVQRWIRKAIIQVNIYMYYSLFFFYKKGVKKGEEIFFCDFIENMSKCFNKWIKLDKLEYLKNQSHHLKNSFFGGVLWIRTGRQG